MCTAATYQTKDFYMGRTLDYEFSYGEQIAIIPRNYPINFIMQVLWSIIMPALAWHMWRMDIHCTMMQQMKKDLVWQA